MPDKKDFCLDRHCGPVVVTGFHIDNYKVCKKCHLEISDKLAARIEKDVEDDFPFGLQSLYEKLVRDGVLL